MLREETERTSAPWNGRRRRGQNTNSATRADRTTGPSPSEVQSTACRRPRRVTSPKAPSHGVPRSSECSCATESRGLLGRPEPGSTSAFPPRPPVCSPPPSPATFAAGSSSTELSSPSEFYSLQPAHRVPASLAATRRPASASLGVFPLFATPTGGGHLPRREPISTLRSAHGVSHALDGFIRHRPCGFVSPRSRVQGSPSRGLSFPAEPYAVSRARCPRAVTTNPPAVARASRPAPDFRAFTPRRECGGDEKRLSLPPLRAPRGLPSSGCSLPAPFSARRAPLAQSPSGLARPRR
jgi:hypothetical protein